MTVETNFPGSWQTFFQAPTTTAAAAVYSVPTGVKSAVLIGLNISATTGGAAATVWISNGVTDYPVLDAKSITANTAELYTFGNPVLKTGWSVKIKDGTGSKLTFAATIAEETRS